MTIDDYKKALSDLALQYEHARSEYHRQFALSNNTVKHGDVFTDHIGSILVERIGVCFSGLDTIPSCKYYGKELKKDGTPKKNNTYRTAYQSNSLTIK